MDIFLTLEINRLKNLKGHNYGYGFFLFNNLNYLNWNHQIIDKKFLVIRINEWMNAYDSIPIVIVIQKKSSINTADVHKCPQNNPENVPLLMA